MIPSDRPNHSIDAILHGNDNQHSGNSHSSSRRRRTRTVFPVAAIRRMEEEFELNKYPDIRLREAIATGIGVSEARVQVWFQNRRARNNKRHQPTDIVPDVGNARKRQRVEPQTGHNKNAMACTDVRLQSVASTPKTSQRPASIYHGVHTQLYPFYPYMYYSVLPSLQTSSQLQIALASYRPETKTMDDASDDIVNRLFRFSSSGSNCTSGQQEVDPQQQKRVYRMVVPTKKTTDCSVTELRASDSARVYREHTGAFTLDDEDSSVANDSFSDLA